MDRLNLLTRAGLAVGMTTLLSVAATSAAQAAIPSDPYTAFYGHNEAWSDIGYQPPPGATKAEHRYVAVIDKECDGNKTQVDFVLKAYPGHHYHYYDGSCTGGGVGALQSSAVHAFRVCELDGSTWHCSGYVYPSDVVYA